MHEREFWLDKLLGATDKALDLTHRSDPSLYLALLRVRRRLEQHAARSEAGAELSRPSPRRLA